MKKNQVYRLCLKAGSFQDTPVFKIKVGKFEKTVNTYFVRAEKQRYNYDLYLERSKESEIMIEVFTNQELIGTGKLKFDPNKPQLPNEAVDIMNKKTKIATLQCSLKKIQKRIKKVPMKIKIIQASYSTDLDSIGKMDPFAVIKYGDNNYKTKVAEGGGKTPVWKEQFNIGTGDNDRIFIESWEQDAASSQFIGLAIVDIASKLGSEHEIDVMKEKKKVGAIKIQLQEHTSKRPDDSEQINDKNIVAKRSVKVYAVEAVMMKDVKKGSFVRLQLGNQQFETTPIFSELKELKWNQSFTMRIGVGEELIAKICIKDEMQQQIGRCSLNTNMISNKKFELAVIDQEQKQIGKLYLQFYDEQMDIKQEMNPMEKSQKNISGISSETDERIRVKNEEIKARYANRQSIHDYMADINAVLQQGLLMIAKQRPQHPIKQLGLYLINYEK